MYSNMMGASRVRSWSSLSSCMYSSSNADRNHTRWRPSPRTLLPFCAATIMSRSLSTSSMCSLPTPSRASPDASPSLRDSASAVMTSCALAYLAAISPCSAARSLYLATTRS